jgi:hypothetical protein
MPSLFTYGLMCLSLAPEQLQGFYSFLKLKSLLLLMQFLVQLNIQDPAPPSPKWGPSDCSKTQYGCLLKNRSNDIR